jgi:hypothetical protein
VSDFRPWPWFKRWLLEGVAWVVFVKVALAIGVGLTVAATAVAEALPFPVVLLPAVAAFGASVWCVNQVAKLLSRRRPVDPTDEPQPAVRRALDKALRGQQLDPKEREILKAREPTVVAPTVEQASRPDWTAFCADAGDSDMGGRHGAAVYLRSDKETARNIRCHARRNDEAPFGAKTRGGQVGVASLHYPGDFEGATLAPGRYKIEWLGYIGGVELLLANATFEVNDKLQVFCHDRPAPEPGASDPVVSTKVKFAEGNQDRPTGTEILHASGRRDAAPSPEAVGAKATVPTPGISTDDDAPRQTEPNMHDQAASSGDIALSGTEWSFRHFLRPKVGDAAPSRAPVQISVVGANVWIHEVRLTWRPKARPRSLGG